MAVLVCGGAGYIGSHAVRALLEKGEQVIVIDNLMTGFAASLPENTPFYSDDIRDATALDHIFTEHKIDTVMHFAASSQVGESVLKPLKYFNNNIYGMQVLLEAMLRHAVPRIVFSSTAAVYGMPKEMPIQEGCPTKPANPYGESKLAMEHIMHWVSQAHDINYVSLRYFNVAGAEQGGCIGEAHEPETHLIPLILQAALGKREKITIFGEDYNTPDGSCIRDYIHVSDLVDAHILALEYLRQENSSEIFNLGNGLGFSVKEMIDAAERVVGTAIPKDTGPRRAGDPDQLVASSEKAKKVLGWKPVYTEIEEIIRTAWNWHKNHPNGYC